MKKIRVHRLVRKRTLEAGEEQRRSRAAPAVSWACVRTAAPRREEEERFSRGPARTPAARTPPPPRRGIAAALIAPAVELAGAAVSLARRPFGRRRGILPAVLAIAAAFAGGMVLEFTTGPTAPALAYIGGFAATVQGWFSPAARTALVAGGLLVAVGLWLVIQVLKTAPDERAVRVKNTCIPREMYERHA